MELFDITPLGRLLNRFSRDIDTADNVLPVTIRSALSQLFAVIKFFSKFTKKKKQFLCMIVIETLYQNCKQNIF